jgi:predicted acetylornithine/succinylornithine family transaminase
METIKKLYSDYVMPTYAPEIALVKGIGSHVWDKDGKEYLDFTSGIAVTNIGHSHPAYIAAIEKQLHELVHVSNLFYTEPQALLAKEISEISMGGKCFFANSGAEANEGMIKLARLWGHDDGKYEIITMKQSFHGRTLATAAATGQDKIQKGFEPMPTGFVYAEFNNLDSVKALINKKTVAIMFEAIQGEGGVMPATPEFVEGVRAICDEKNLLMLCDEVQCGMARTGKWFGYQHYSVEPDVISFAKALGNGFPIGGITASPKYSDILQVGKHATTFGGTPLACSAALAVLKVCKDECLVEKAVESGKYFTDGLLKVIEGSDEYTGVRGKGLLLGLVSKNAVKPLYQKLADNGVLTVPAGPNVLRFIPPLNVSKEDMDKALATVNAIING